MIYDVLVIGGGAAGLCAAIQIKKQKSDAVVGLAEQLSRVGKKLITTGNGRCNITNKNCTLERYHGENIEFASYALEKYDNDKIAAFFGDLGLLFTYEGEKAYPYSLQASSVVDVLRFGAERLGVELLTDTKITDFELSGGLYTLKTQTSVIKAKNIIVATGLLSGGEKLGSDGLFFGIMKKKGYSYSKTTPAIVQLKTDNNLTKSLKGIKVNAEVSLTLDGKVIRRDYGEVLFCDYGLSGPPIMQLSRETARGGGEFYIKLDIMPEYDFDSLFNMLKLRKSTLSSVPLEEFFTGLLNKRVGQAILKQAGFKLSDNTDILNDKALRLVTALIKSLSFKVTGNTGFINSQVTAGGLKTDSFNDKTMMSKKHKGLYAIGEILDIDGDCGGFNLRWAWSSALCAADAITENL
ncbi:MAG: aminoacetone oxidase family FAD-binding enzyme [Ruminococcaceae bacterium]|nr:aminoacetone oxidase family FAD-binding enzyme [Oscillospiraceae bacterium]